MKRFVVIAILSLVIGCSKDQAPTSCPTCTNPILDSSAAILVARVVDGDTLKFSVGSDTIDVRVLGIDAFETKYGSHLNNQATQEGIDSVTAIQIGLKAKAFADSLLTNKMVTIYRDPSESYADNFGRLLRHVFFTDGRSQIDFGELMLEKHFALKD